MNSCIWRVDASEDSSSTYKRLSPVSGCVPFCKMTLESWSLHGAGGLSKLVGRARCRRESFDLVPLRFGTFTDHGEGRRPYLRPGETIQAHDLLAIRN